MLRDKVIEIFVKADDFCKEFDLELEKHRLGPSGYKARDRKAALADSEIITILMLFTAVILPILSIST